MTSTQTSNDSEIRASKVIRSLLSGGMPNGTDPQDCGRWVTVITEYYQAHATGGTAAVQKLHNSLTKQYPDLIRLVAGTPPSTAPASQAPVSDIPMLPKSAQLDEMLGSTACPWLDQYVAFSRQWSPRSYSGFHEAAGLWVLSTVAARRVMLDLGGQRYTNMYIAICGRTSVWAKSTAAKIAIEVLRAADLASLLAADDSTPQAFVRNLATRTPQNYAELPTTAQEAVAKRLAFAGQRGWYFDEFGQKISAMMREGSAMADYRGLLRRFDDCPAVYEYQTIARGADLIDQPYLALLANLTPADLAPYARRGGALWNDGFFARFAFVTPPATNQPTHKQFPPGERIIPSYLAQPLKHWHQQLGVPVAQIAERLDAKGKGTGVHDVTIVPPLTPTRCTLGQGVFECFYKYHDGLMDALTTNQNYDLDGNYARFAEKALRCAMLLASFENNGRIELRHWARAQAITERWRANLHSLISQLNEDEPSRHRTNEDKVLAVLSRATSPQTAREISQGVRGLSTAEVTAILDPLTKAGIVQKITGGKTVRYQVI